MKIYTDMSSRLGAAGFKTDDFAGVLIVIIKQKLQMNIHVYKYKQGIINYATVGET
jgi:hypothetical protein